MTINEMLEKSKILEEQSKQFEPASIEHISKIHSSMIMAIGAAIASLDQKLTLVMLAFNGQNDRLDRLEGKYIPASVRGN